MINKWWKIQTNSFPSFFFLFSLLPAIVFALPHPVPHLGPGPPRSIATKNLHLLFQVLDLQIDDTTCNSLSAFVIASYWRGGRYTKVKHNKKKRRAVNHKKRICKMATTITMAVILSTNHLCWKMNCRHLETGLVCGMSVGFLGSGWKSIKSKSFMYWEQEYPGWIGRRSIRSNNIGLLRWRKSAWKGERKKNSWSR